MEGKALPSGARPWTKGEAKDILENLRPSDDFVKTRKEVLLSQVTDEETGFNYRFNVRLAPKGIFQTGHSYATSLAVIPSDLEEDPINICATINQGNFLSGFVNLNIGAREGDAEDYNKYKTRTTVNDISKAYYQMSQKYTHAIGTNIPWLMNEGIAVDFPNRAYVTLGNSFARFTVGRDRLSWGNGEMGNLILGDTLSYHDYFTLTFKGGNVFKYQLLTTFFSHPKNYDLEEVEPGTAANDYDRRPTKGVRFMLGHRFEFNFLKGRLSFVFNEAVMYQSEEGTVDFRVLNPLLFMHNFYIAGNANSLASIEVNFAKSKNVSYYLQLAIDDLPVGEARAPSDGASVDGYAAVLGRKSTKAKADGYLYDSLELVYTSPFMYHRANGAYEKNDQSLYYVSTTRISSGGTVQNVSRYLSYAFGSDALVAQYKLGYKRFEGISYEGTVLLMAHGVIDKYSRTYYYSDSIS
ncbi:MAG: hypothetical protein K6G51_01555, partial [Sphaerochaetaceae bacterium]|nr:hypothetical protein [Sphaerochaetaceae bacterium]